MMTLKLNGTELMLTEMELLTEKNLDIYSLMSCTMFYNKKEKKKNPYH